MTKYVTVGLFLVVLYVPVFLAVTQSPTCDMPPGLAGRHHVAWKKAFAHERLNDVDLQALSDAQDILECR